MSVGILDISLYTKSEQSRIAEKPLTRFAKNVNSVTHSYSNTLHLVAFFFGGAAPAFAVAGYIHSLASNSVLQTFTPQIAAANLPPL